MQDTTQPTQAQQILNEAKDAVSKLLKDAAQEIEQGIAQAREEGLEQGEKQASDFEDKLKHLQRLMQQEEKKDILSASLEAALMIIEKEIEREPKYLVFILKTALQGVPPGSHVLVRLNPKDASQIAKHPDLLSDIVHSLEMREDHQVEPGGVIVHTDVGVIDAQPKTQIEELKTSLFENLH